MNWLGTFCYSKILWFERYTDYKGKQPTQTKKGLQFSYTPPKMDAQNTRDGLESAL